MNDPNNDRVASGAALFASEAVHRNFWAIVAAGAAGLVGWYSASTQQADKFRNEIEKLKADVALLKTETDALELQGAQRRVLLGCTVLTMQRVADNLGIERPCPMELPQ